MQVSTHFTIGLQTSMSGNGRHLGINIRWSVHWRSDGAFVEEINGKELNFLWGCDSQAGSSCWEVRLSAIALQTCYTYKHRRFDLQVQVCFILVQVVLAIIIIAYYACNAVG